MVQIIQLWENWNSKFSVCVLGHWTISLRMAEIKATTQSNHKFLGSWFISKIHFVVRKKNHCELKYQQYAWERKFTIFFFNQLILERIKSLFRKVGEKRPYCNLIPGRKLSEKKYQNRELNNAGLSFIFTIQQTSIEHLGRHKTYNNHKTTSLPRRSHWCEGGGGSRNYNIC